MVSRPGQALTPISSAYSSIQHHQQVPSISHHYETAANVQQMEPQPLDQNSLLKHQEIIAQSHPDGSFFLTQEGQYVQLINGVLTNVNITPMMQGPVQYSELAFEQQQNYNAELEQKLQQLHQQQVFQEQHQIFPPQQQHQMFPPQQQNQVFPAQPQQQQNIPQQMQLEEQPGKLGPTTKPKPAKSGTSFQRPRKLDQLSVPLLKNGGNSPTGSVRSSEFSRAPTVSHIGSAADIDQDNDKAKTRMEMRMQADLAKNVGIRCSQL